MPPRRIPDRRWWLKQFARFLHYYFPLSGDKEKIPRFAECIEFLRERRIYIHTYIYIFETNVYYITPNRIYEADKKGILCAGMHTPSRESGPNSSFCACLL